METLQQATLVADSYDSSDVFIEGTSDDYSFPKNCPYCNQELIIGNLKWADSTTALCPNCESAIRAT
jgi:transcription elongation factor Elf1